MAAQGCTNKPKGKVFNMEFKGYKKGINLGGWLSQCGNNYNEKHYSEFISEKDIERIAGMGLDHVRLPIDYNVIRTEDGCFIESGFAHIDECIEWCGKKGLNILLDLHKTCGFVFDDAQYCSFFTDERLQDYFVQLWEEIARRYGNRPNIAFELLNEVTSREFAEPWNRIIDRTIKAIRKIALETKIVVGGIFNCSIYGLTLLERPQDENIVFTFHCYNPLLFTHQGAYWVDRLPSDFRINYPGRASDYKELSSKFFGDDFTGDYNGYEKELIGSDFFEKLFAPAVEAAEKFGVPVYCGEYGVIDIADPESSLSWYKDINAAFEKLGISRAAWTYKEMDFGIIGKHYESVYDGIVKAL